MPPIWLCLDCEGVAYGWARGYPCIYCGSSRLVGTDVVYYPDENPTDYRLVFLPPKQWAQLEAEALLADKTCSELLSEREQAPVVLICDERVQGGKLVLFRRSQVVVAEGSDGDRLSSPQKPDATGDKIRREQEQKSTTHG